MSKSILIDTTVCTACRGCQVACKQWHDLPGEKTVNVGSYQNPQDLSSLTYKLVRMNETVVKGKLEWLFFPDQCRHCVEAPCLETAEEPKAIYSDDATGAILYTQESRSLDGPEIIDACPYDIPRAAKDGTLTKCDFCNDRIHNGLAPACVSSCPTGAMTFGDRGEILDLAEKRLGIVKKKFPDAMLVDPDEVNVIYLLGHAPESYASSAVGNRKTIQMSRSVAIRKMMGPFASLMKV